MSAKHPKGDPATLVQQYLRAGDVAIDVGACRGDITAVMVKCVGPQGHVYALEPDTRLASKFDERLTQPNVTRLECAAWDRSIMVTIHQAEQHEQTSVFRGAVEKVIGTVEVSTRRLDDVTPKAVALVKIDAQGAEPIILRGATQLLRQCPAWIIEVWPVGLKYAQSSPLALFEQLVDAGLTPCWADARVVQRSELAAWDDGPKYVNWICTR